MTRAMKPTVKRTAKPAQPMINFGARDFSGLAAELVRLSKASSSYMDFDRLIDYYSSTTREWSQGRIKPKDGEGKTSPSLGEASGISRAVMTTVSDNQERRLTEGRGGK